MDLDVFCVSNAGERNMKGPMFSSAPMLCGWMSMYVIIEKVEENGNVMESI